MYKRQSSPVETRNKRRISGRIRGLWNSGRMEGYEESRQKGGDTKEEKE